MQALTLTPVAIVHNHRDEVVDDHWGEVESILALDPDRFGPEALVGLGDFSHLEVVFVMHRVAAEKIVHGGRSPRGRADLPAIGIFAQRGKNRPNRLGVSRCELLEIDGIRLRVRGLDAIDGTPVVDIKPWMREFGPRGPVRQPPWVGEIMDRYFLGEG